MYKDLTTDFADRSSILLEKYYPCMVADKKEITFLIMVATSAFVIPVEKLTKHEAHKYNLERGKKIKNSFLSPLLGEEITFGECKEDLNPDSWDDDKKSLDTKEVAWFLMIIRNALAHGNIHFVDDKNGNIKKIAFVSENRKKSDKCSACSHIPTILNETHPYKYIRFENVDGFKQFLELWFQFLKP